MLRSILLVLLGALVGLGCDGGKRYPTAPAPKTLKIEPMAAMAARTSDSDDDDDELDDGDDEAPARRRRGPSSTGQETMGPVTQGTGSALSSPGAESPRPTTINGHPLGPRAEVFNAVVNNAFASALPCFAQADTTDTLSFQVEMTVSNDGVVESAQVLSGPSLPKVRSCLQGVVKRLAFPAFQGPKVTQTIPFTAVQQGGGQAP